MALARIISHSHEHCRELAVDLLARGYAVEIVSPDKIPDNFADLELRVDTDAANDLTAKVAARTGQHSSFLDFVHHLNAPMGDFVRRPAKPKFESIANLTPVSFNAEPSIAEVEVPARSQNLEPALVSTVEIADFEIPKPTFSPKIELPTPPQIPIVPPPAIVPPIAEDRISAISGTEEVPARPIRPRPKRGLTIIVHRPRPEPKIKGRNSKQASGSWFLQVAAGFALIVALSAIPIVGIRGVDPLVPKASADTQKIAAAAPQQSSASRTTIRETPKAPAEIHNQGREPSPSASYGKKPLRQAVVAKGLAQTKELASDAPLIYRDRPVSKAHASHEKVRHQHQDDSIAQDTVTYIDRGLSPRNH